MIKFILVQNRTGKTRIARWYVNYTQEEQKKILFNVHSLVSVRHADDSNFLETPNFKIVYKVYASMYFCIGCDFSDNSIYMLENIHNIVEVINSYFDGVCELDIIFHFIKVYQCIDIMFTAGDSTITSHQIIKDKLTSLVAIE